MTRKKSTGSRGYNLVEVMIAMALLGVVTISIVTLFFMARSNIYAGRQMTSAVSVGTRIMEDLSGTSVPTLLTSFNIPDTATLGSVTVAPPALPESSYTGSVARDTTVITTAGTCAAGTLAFANDTNGYLQRWYCQTQGTNNQLANSSVTLIFTPHNPNPTTAALTMGNATVLHIRAIIRWTEGPRNRQIVMDLTKTRRPLT